MWKKYNTSLLEDSSQLRGKHDKDKDTYTVSTIFSYFLFWNWITFWIFKLLKIRSIKFLNIYMGVVSIYVTNVQSTLKVERRRVSNWETQIIFCKLTLNAQWSQVPELAIVNRNVEGLEVKTGTHNFLHTIYMELKEFKSKYVLVKTSWIRQQ